jgi:heme exporter protein A
LAVRGLAVRRGDRVLFRGFDLDVAPGDVVWLRAANGYGKTSLLRLLAGLAKPEAGTIAWTHMGDLGVTGTILYLAHANALKEDLTVEESLQHLVRLHALDRTNVAIVDAIRRFGLFTRRHAPIRTLSQGQRRRVALAHLCLSDATTPWILDEPFDALDADGAAIVGDLIAEHAAGGGLVVLTSHVPPAFDDRLLRTVALDAAAAT